ncbi:MAG: hypothetical protein JO255_12750, partial [Alphaproteobacteria bacterium]|nr:hypothetical protein [Alphaproteobacteria bacterium]
MGKTLKTDLKKWADRIAKAGSAITLLTSEPVFLRLKAQMRANALTGVSAACAAEIVASADQLWSLFLLLDS